MENPPEHPKESLSSGDERFFFQEKKLSFFVGFVAEKGLNLKDSRKMLGIARILARIIFTFCQFFRPVTGNSIAFQSFFFFCKRQVRGIPGHRYGCRASQRLECVNDSDGKPLNQVSQIKLGTIHRIRGRASSNISGIPRLFLVEKIDLFFFNFILEIPYQFRKSIERRRQRRVESHPVEHP